MNKKEKVDLREVSTHDDDGVLRPEKVVLFHTTDYPPIWKDGHFCIQSTFKARDHIFLRDTIHFAVGHIVEANIGGSWDDKGIVIVTPLQGTIDENDVPVGMSAVDTFFETRADEDLVLPKDAHVFMPGDPKKFKDGWSYTEDNITYYKTSGFTQKEKENILFYYDSPPWYDQKRHEMDLWFDVRNIEKSLGMSNDEIMKQNDAFFAQYLRTVLTDRFCAEQGYSLRWMDDRNDPYRSQIARLGEKLDCPMVSGDSALHYNSYFNNSRMDLIGEFVWTADFMLHSDEYRIVGETGNPNSGRKDYQFVREKDGKSQSIIWRTWSGEYGYSDEADDIVYGLQHGWIPRQYYRDKDSLKLLDEEVQEERIKFKWSPIYCENYEVWKATIESLLPRLFEEAKGVDFDALRKKLEKRVTEFSAQQSKKKSGKASVHDVLVEANASKKKRATRQRVPQVPNNDGNGA